MFVCVLLFGVLLVLYVVDIVVMIVIEFVFGCYIVVDIGYMFVYLGFIGVSGCVEYLYNFDLFGVVVDKFVVYGDCVLCMLVDGCEIVFN